MMRDLLVLGSHGHMYAYSEGRQLAHVMDIYYIYREREREKESVLNGHVQSVGVDCKTHQES